LHLTWATRLLFQLPLFPVSLKFIEFIFQSTHCSDYFIYHDSGKADTGLYVLGYAASLIICFEIS
jgi:hypothetical protein